MLYLLGRRLGASRAAAALVAAGTALGTYLLPYGRDFFAEPLVALALVLMVERALAGRGLQAGTALGLAVLARPQSALLAPLLFGYLLLRGGGIAAVLRTLPPIVIAALITVAYNLHRFRDPLEFGYSPPVDPGFTTPLLEGASGLLFSPEKSVVLFAPVIVLVPLALVALWRRDRPTASLLLALFAATFVLTATWWSWQGGWSWGPRLLIPGVALVLVVLAPWIGTSSRRLKLTAALFALGFVLSFSAVLAPPAAQLFNGAAGVDGPQIVRQYRELPELFERSIDAATDSAARGAGYGRYLAPWQATLAHEFGPVGALLALLGTIALLAALFWTAAPLKSRLRPA